MLYRMPDYYRTFRCIAGECEDTCCAGWQIAVDDKALRKYKAVRGTFRRKMRRSINWKKGIFRQDKEGRCAFLNEENLCDMYLALGAKGLCKTCRTYPRHVEEFEGVREFTLSLSCPEAADILMKRREPVTFLTVKKEGNERYEDYDTALYHRLSQARNAALDILQNRAVSVEVREGLLYGLAHDLQRCIEQNELTSCDKILEKYRSEAARKFVSERVSQNRKNVKKQFLFAEKMFRKLGRLEPLREGWELLVLETEQRLFGENSPKEYQEVTEEFRCWIFQNDFPWEIQKEQLLVYFIAVYFCGAVYDGNVLSKAQMAIISVGLLEEMLKVRWLRNEKMLDVQDVTEIVYRYSREMEHSERNIKRMEAMMPKKHALYC